MGKKKIKLEKFMVYFIAFIMVSSIFGIIFSGYRQDSYSVKYNGIAFERRGNMWFAAINGGIGFDYHPEEVENINLSGEVEALLQDKIEIDVTSDIESPFKDDIAVAVYNMENTLSATGVYVRSGFTEENDFNIPVISCSDSSQFVPVVYFQEMNKTEVIVNNSCIIAGAASEADILRIKDRLLYSILGIIR